MAGPIARMLNEHGDTLDPDVIARLEIAYRVVLDRLGLAERKEAATLIVAKRLIELALQGEHDPERLITATVAALKK
jgi:hypothetical protein